MHFSNQVQLVGRAGSGAATELLSDGSRIARLRLYQPPGNNNGKDSEPPPPFRIIAWNGVAEQLHARVRRGDRLLVQGRLVNRRARDGERSYIRTEVHLAHFVVIATESRPCHAVSPISQP